jgi:hypothetical protein
MTTPTDPVGADELDGLLADLFEQGLTDEGWRSLRLLLVDPQRRRRYRRYVRIHALLDTELLLPQQLPTVDAAGLGSSAGMPIPMDSLRVPADAPHRVGYSRWLRAVAALVVAAIGALAWMLLRAQPEGTVSFATISSIEDMTSAPWRTGARLERGPLLVPAGIMHVVFDSGVALTVRGPARVAFISPQAVSVETGALVAHVPANAVGFLVATPQAQLVDLGTEFGVAVAPSGHTDVQVRQGRIALTTGAVREPAVLVAGEARRIDSTGTVSTAAFDAALFSFSPATDNAASRWQAALRRLLQDPDVVAWYEASGAANPGTEVLNSAPAHAASSGMVSGPQITSGRMPGSLAWQFAAPGDRIRITIPGRYKAISLLAWVRFDRFGKEPTALLATDGWGVPPLFQWQCQPNGIMTLSLCSNTTRIWSWHAEQALPRTAGLWHLLGCTIENDGTVRFYGDGILLGESRHHIILDAAIGPALIGDWASYAHDQAQPPSNRQLHGTLDGFGIVARAMTIGEMVELSSAGRP